MDYSYSFILGPLILLALYALCFFLVVGVKVSVLFFRNKLSPTKEEPPPIAKPKKQRKTIKTIEIDSNTVDRIYFKKSS